MANIICKRHHQEHPVPKRSKQGDAGYDLYCDEDKVIPIGQEATISLGIDVKVPSGSVGLILPRSSANKLGLHVKTGVIDSGYTGPMFALVHNISNKPVDIKKGMRICQILPMMLMPCHDEMLEVDEMPETERGRTGFGSTGDSANHV